VNILVIVAHPDDEVLGMGGTIKKLSKKHTVSLCVVSEGASAQYKEKKMIQVRRNDCIKCGKILGITNFEFLNYPDMQLDTVPHLVMNIDLEKLLKKYKPDIVYTTPYHDLNQDHQRVFESTLVATRSTFIKIKKLLCFELPGNVRIPFEPNLYENISSELKTKTKAFNQYKSEVEKFPHPRSTEAIESLSLVRGTESGFKHAEAFKLIKEYIQ
jgi:LmbE family N-acetylglucosaminyl deacetylase